MKPTKKLRIEILNKQILRLAKLYIKLKVNESNFDRHNRIMHLQCNCIAEKKFLQRKAC